MDSASAPLSLAKVPSSEPWSVRVLKRLRVKQSSLDKAPDISAVLKETYGGLSLAVEAMRFSTNSDLIQRWLARFDRLSDRDRKIPRIIEAVALSQEIPVADLFGHILLALREYSVYTVKAIAVSHHPEIMKKRVEFAKLPGGFRDRDALDLMLGALPSNKGSTFIQKAVFTSTDSPENDVPEEAHPQEIVDDMDFVFPNAEDVQDKLVPIRQRLVE